MSLFTRVRPGLRVRHPAARDVERILDFLDRRPAENVFLSHLLRRDGLAPYTLARAWHLAEREGEIRGVCVVASNLVPAAEDEDAAHALGEALGRIRPGTQSIVGERDAVAALWERVGPSAPRVRLLREEQPFYVLGAGDRRPAATGELRLRRARPADLDLLVDASAEMLREEILDDPHARDPVAFRAQIWRMIGERAIFVAERAGDVVFKAHVNVRTPFAAQISGVFTLPEHRARGYATEAMRTLSDWLLREVPLLCLYVNRENVAAVHAYEAAGFRRAGTFQSIFLEGR